MMSQAVSMVNKPDNVAHDLIDFIFLTLLPQYGMTVREPQVELAHRMLDVLIGRQIGLHEAGVGIGKTFSYLIAGIAFHLCLPDDWWVRSYYPFSNTYQKRTPMPIIISTSSIALQQAIYAEYIPFLSAVLTEHHVIQKPLQVVIRKGKSHYVCDKRLAEHLNTKNVKAQNSGQRDALLSLRQGSIDLDKVPNLSDYDRKRICVDRSCANQCPNRFGCRYFRQMIDAKSPEILFQICNHNYLLADQIHRQIGKEALLPNYKGLIIDEAHKLHDAAQQMYGITIGPNDMSYLIEATRNLKGLRCEDQVLLNRLVDDQSELFAELKKSEHGLLDPESKIDVANSYRPTADIRYQLQKLANGLRKLMDLLDRLDNRKLRNQCNRQLEHVSLFLQPKDSIVYQLNFNDKSDSVSLVATPADVSLQLADGVWNSPIPAILTSGTLAVRQDFSRIRSVLGLDLVSKKRVIDEWVVSSPFDYQRNCLIYLPQRLPDADLDSKFYLQAIADQVTQLVQASQGHTLVLFNSYRLMSRIRERVDPEQFSVPLMVTNRDVELTISRFKAMPNAVLFATGSCWEGIDFAGDVVSSLIIVTLPFSVPDEIKRQEQRRYPCLRDYIDSTVVPAMQQKLKQGFGRAFRTETDTCVVSILDPRALHGARYHRQALAALPDCPLTHQLQDVAEFIYRVKDQSYFTI
jgi:ATP-dependent DNA helicase DinG